MRLPTVSAILALAFCIMAAPVTDLAVEGNATLVSPLFKRVTTYNGEGTVYTQNGGIGSCGKANPDSALIGALSNYWMKSQSPSPYCGRSVQVTNTGSNDGVGGKGNVVTVKVADTCPSCNEEHIDFSVGAWNKLTNNAPYGTVYISWKFV